MRPGLRRKLNPFIEPDWLAEQAEKTKASIRAKVEHPFRVLKRQFGYAKVRTRSSPEPPALCSPAHGQPASQPQPSVPD